MCLYEYSLSPLCDLVSSYLRAAIYWSYRKNYKLAIST